MFSHYTLLPIIIIIMFAGIIKCPICFYIEVHITLIIVKHGAAAPNYVYSYYFDYQNLCPFTI